MGSTTRASGGRAVEGPTDPGRRRFFRAFAGQLLHAATEVIGAVAALQQSSADAARTILGDAGASTGVPATGSPPPPPASLGPPAAEGGPVGRSGRAPGGFRTPFRLEDDAILLVDQRRLPDELVEVPCRTAAEVVDAIREMVVRGAPALGQVAALALALAARRARGATPAGRRQMILGTAAALVGARPTAVNLRWAVERLLAVHAAVGDDDGDALAAALEAEAEAIVWEATEDHGRIAEAGLALLPVPAARPLQLLTHCNTGPLAGGQFGTALGIVQAAHQAGRSIHVWVDETRPYLQGARLTAWELANAGVPHTLVVDAAAGWLLARGQVDVVVVGADRIAANGDTANKIGTYPLAVLARRHGVPFYVAAPLATVDPAAPDGSAIPIEERPAAEVLALRGIAIAPPGTEAANPAFDVTPAELIDAIVTEEGALRPPYRESLAAALEARRRRPPRAPFPGHRGGSGGDSGSARAGLAEGRRW